MRTVIVSGAIANKPRSGGEAWVRLSFVLGLRRLGLDVVFVEQLARNDTVGEDGRPAPFAASVNREHFRSVLSSFGLLDRACLLFDGGAETEGLPYGDMLEVAHRADLLVNISGHLTREALIRPVQRRIYVDVDPGYTQIWAAEGDAAARLQGHDAYFTVAENVGLPGCSIPDTGLAWRPLRRPVVMGEWPALPSPALERFTTVSTWRNGYGSLHHDGHEYGQKVHEFRKVIDLPSRIEQTCELALDIHPGDRRDLMALRDHGWQLVDPVGVAGDARRFRDYLQGSDAEFSVVQPVYAEMGTGWLSDRSAHYLASGKPVLVQDTGLARNYPVGEGLVTFRTLDEAAAAARAMAARHAHHAEAARELAEQELDSDDVLNRMLDEVDGMPASRARK